MIISWPFYYLFEFLFFDFVSHSSFCSNAKVNLPRLPSYLKYRRGRLMSTCFYKFFYSYYPFIHRQVTLRYHRIMIYHSLSMTFQPLFSLHNPNLCSKIVKKLLKSFFECYYFSRKLETSHFSYHNLRNPVPKFVLHQFSCSKWLDY